MRLLRKAIYLATLSLSGCNTSGQQSLMREIDYAGWQSPAKLSLEVYDTTATVDLQIALRYDSAQLRDSINLMIATITPDRVRWNDNITLHLDSQQRGITNRDFDFRQDVKWGQIGKYQIAIYPQHNYKGISAIGVNIKEHQ